MISEIRPQAVRLTKAVYVRHYYIMSDNVTLGKRRTVRFEARIDGLISARAEAEKENGSVPAIVEYSLKRVRVF